MLLTKLHKKYRLLAWYFAIEIIIESVLVLLASNGIRNIGAVNIWKIVQLLYLSNLYFMALADINATKHLRILKPAIVVLALIGLSVVFFNGWDQMAVGYTFLNQGVLMILGFYTLLQYASRSHKIKLSRNMYFWIVLILSFYFSTKVVLYIPLEIGLSDPQKLDYGFIYINLHKYVLITRDLLLAYCIYRCRK